MPIKHRDQKKMRQGNQNKQRMRGRSRKSASPATRTYDSNGPDVKVRGNAHHIAEKYQQLARDAQGAGDRIMAENYLQHAEHYTRIIASVNPNTSSSPRINVEAMDGGAKEFPESSPVGSEIIVTDSQEQTDNELSGFNSEKMSNGSVEEVVTETVQDNPAESPDSDSAFSKGGYRPTHRASPHRTRSGSVRRSAISRSRSSATMRSTAKN